MPINWNDEKQVKQHFRELASEVWDERNAELAALWNQSTEYSTMEFERKLANFRDSLAELLGDLDSKLKQ